MEPSKCQPTAGTAHPAEFYDIDAAPVRRALAELGRVQPLCHRPAAAVPCCIQSSAGVTHSGGIGLFSGETL